MPDSESVAQEPVVQKPIRDEQRRHDNHEVQKLTEDEAVVIDVVFVVNIGTEELQKEKRIKNGRLILKGYVVNHVINYNSGKS